MKNIIIYFVYVFLFVTSAYSQSPWIGFAKPTNGQIVDLYNSRNDVYVSTLING